ncbi:hypothetical protein M8J77_019219 [Diaphorina citri]|nr:hypothetical protein M8J77_019219 [Diaphorina citri]
MSPSYNHNTALEQSGGRRNFNKGAVLMWLAHELSIPTRSRGCLTREADGLLVVLNPAEYVATMSERMACACNSVPDMPMLNALKRHAPSPFTFTKVKPPR